MAHLIEGTGRGWTRLDRATFGPIYGAIMVLSLLKAMRPTDHSPFMMAGVLFGSVLSPTKSLGAVLIWLARSRPPVPYALRRALRLT